MGAVETAAKNMAPRKWQQALAWLMLALCSLIYVTRGYHDQRFTLQSSDFKTVYGSARCLLRGCDPWDSEQIFRAYSAAGGSAEDMNPFRPHEPLYFPSALSLITPIALLSWEPAHLVWLAISTGVFVLSVWLIADLCFTLAPLVTALALGVFLLTSTTLIMLAQPAQLTIGLCAIAAWCLLKEKFVTVGVVCFALSLTLKPHVTGLVWLYLLLRDRASRRRAWQIAMATVLICLPGVIWATAMPASSHWLTEIPANVRGITAHGLIGDPGPANDAASSIAGLHPLLSLYRDDPAFYNKAALAIGAALLAAWVVPVLRLRPSVERDYIGLAAVVCISLLPIYHREYDTRILLLTFPAFALLMTRALATRVTTAVITSATIIFITHNWINFVTLHVTSKIVAQHGSLNVWETILWLRPVPVFTLLLTLFYLAWLYRIWWIERQLNVSAFATEQVQPFVRA